MTLETWLKIVFLLNCDTRHASTTWKELIQKSCVCPFLEISQKS